MDRCTEGIKPKKHRVKCLICKETIPYDREKPDLIVNHVRMFHPNLEIAGLTHTSSPESLYQCASPETVLSQNDDRSCRQDSNPSNTISKEFKEVLSNEFNVPYNRVRLAEEYSKDNHTGSENIARCMLCKMSLQYDKSEPENLVKHVKLFHPYLKVAGMTTNNPFVTLKDITKKSKKERNTRKFEKSVSTWQLENGELLCKKCGAKGKPEKRNSKHNTEGFSTCFKQWCWIFAQFMNRNEFIDLYCVKCKTYLGTYNCTTRMIKRLTPRSYDQLSTPKLYGSYSAPNVALKRSHNDIQIEK